MVKICITTQREKGMASRSGFLFTGLVRIVVSQKRHQGIGLEYHIKSGGRGSFSDDKKRRLEIEK